MGKAHCDIYMRVVAELEHLASTDMDSETKVDTLAQVIQDLRAYESKLEKEAVEG